VVNNGGDPSAVDQVVDVVRASSTPLASQISVIHRDRHDARGSVLHDALAVVTSSFVAVLDQSQTWNRLCASSAVQSLQQHSDALAVCVGYNMVQEKMIDERVWPRHNTGMQLHVGDVSLTSLLSGADVPEHAFVYRTAAVTEVGGVDPVLDHLALWDLNVRIATQGSIAVLSIPLVTLHSLETSPEEENAHRRKVDAERHELISSWMNSTLPGGANKGQCALDALAHRNRESELQLLRDENANLRKEIANFNGLSSRALRAVVQPTKLVRAVQRRLKK
jgi:hypothetical protein